jgi:Xaa-Pro aminopeptidase
MWRVSRAELERRWSLVRGHLIKQGLQALIVQGYEEKIGGNVRWLTDVPPGYPRTVIFHANDLMTIIDHGPQGEVRRLDDRDPNRPGVGELVTNWALYGGHFTTGLGADSVIQVLRARGCTRVGLVNEKSLPHGFTAGIKSLDGVHFTDETDFFDSVKAQKSEEELAMIRGTAAIQDQVFAKLLDWVKPGVRDFELNAYVDYQLQLLGADRGVYIAISAPHDRPAPFGYRHFQGRTMQRGDYTNILLESNGPGGEWAEIGRIVSFGKVRPETRDAHAVCVEAQARTAALCVPGASPAEIFKAHNEFMTSRGSEPERRLHSHGQGYDAVERPLIRSDETMALPPHVNLAIHPVYSGGAAFATICDNYVVGALGAAGFLHQTPKQIFEL